MQSCETESLNPAFYSKSQYFLRSTQVTQSLPTFPHKLRQSVNDYLDFRDRDVLAHL